jgi:2Fe-2S ferredoxin
VTEGLSLVTDIFFEQADGTTQSVAAENGMSLMAVARQNDVPGILADCGGAMSCATCHVYIDEAFVPLVPPAEEVENAMLEMAVDLKENSRLSCQVTISEALAGLVVHVPRSQY